MASPWKQFARETPMLWFKGPKGEDEGVSGREMGMWQATYTMTPLMNIAA